METAKAKNRILLSQLIYPLFVKEGGGSPKRINSMPGIYTHTLSSLDEELRYVQHLGLRNILLFGVPEEKTWYAEKAYANNSFLSEAIGYIKAHFRDLTVFTDICLCAYSEHGHCGIINKGREHIESRATLEALSAMAVVHARAGADYVCPSAMASHQVKAIRQALDGQGYQRVKIMGYSAKFASNFYGPFRSAADSAPRFGDRSGYQLDYKDRDKALSKIEQDIKEGADIVMVKPALSYLDIIYQAKQRFSFPLAVYNVSGEYSMIKRGAQLGFWDEEKIVFEILYGMRRAGADYLITYHAPDIARWMKKHGKREVVHTKLSAV